MVILIDTNVVLDYITVRNGYYSNARNIFFLCASKKVTGYIAFHTVPNAFFIMRKEYSTQYRKDALCKICQIVKVTGASHDRVQSALMRADFKDFEDCLQDECAKEVNADYIITRNVTDFKNSGTKAVTPDEFLNIACKYTIKYL